MSYPPPPGQDPNNPYAQQGQQPGYGYPPQAPGGQGGYGYPQDQQAAYGYPQGQQPGYGYPQDQQAAYGVPQQMAPGQPGYGYGYPGAVGAPGTVQASNGYINLHHLGTLQLANMGQRFVARLLDGVILGVIISIAMAIGLAGSVGLTADCDPASVDYNTCMQDASSSIVATAFTMMAVISGFMLLYEWLMISFVGATLGKMIMGLRVLRESTGQVPGVGSGFIRYIIPVAGALLCYIGALLVYLSPFFDNSGKLQGWHDRAAGTIVIKK